MSNPERRAKGRRANGEGWLSWRDERQRWIASFVFYAGTPQQKRVSKSFVSHRDGVRYLADLRRRAESAQRPSDEKISLGRWFDYWIEIVEASELKPATKSSYRENVKLHAKPQLGHVKLAQLTHRHVHRYLIAQRDRGYSKSMLKLCRTTLALALDQAVLEGRAVRNIAREVPLPKSRKQTKKVAAWTLEEAIRFLNAARDDRIFAAYVLLAMVGLRKGELLALHWEDFDVDAQTLFVCRQVQRVKGTKRLLTETPKSETSVRLIHLPRQAVEVLEAHREKQRTQRERSRRWLRSDLIFTTDVGTHIDPRNFNDFMADVCSRAHIESLNGEARTPHSLRHTAGTVARAFGVDWKDIQMMLGHASIKITMDVYVDAVPELQRRSANLIDEGFRLLPSDVDSGQLSSDFSSQDQQQHSESKTTESFKAQNGSSEG